MSQQKFYKWNIPWPSMEIHMTQQKLGTIQIRNQIHPQPWDTLIIDTNSLRLCWLTIKTITCHATPYQSWSKNSTACFQGIAKPVLPFMILLCSLSYKDQLRKASCRTTPLPLRPGNWRSPLAENKISHLFFPFWGECSLCFVYLHPTPHTLSFCVSLLLPFPFSLGLLPTFCCSILLQWILST